MRLTYCIVFLLIYGLGFEILAQPCHVNGNLVVFSNYDGGVLNIDVDQNIPDLKIGIVAYEPITVNFTGVFVANITGVIYAGFNDPVITGVNSSIITVYSNISGNPAVASYFGDMLDFMEIPLVNCITAGSGCIETDDQGGNSSPQIVQFFYSEFGTNTILFSHTTQYEGFDNNTTYSISESGNCCLEDITTSVNPIYNGNGGYNFLPQDTLLCEGSLTLDLSFYPVLFQPPAYTGYVWNDGTIGPVITITEPGTYSFYVSDYCHYEEAFYLRDTIVVLPCCEIDIPVIESQSGSEYCEGELAQLSTGLFPFYAWSNGSSGQEIVINTSGEYQVTVSDGNGCESTSEVFTVNFFDYPELVADAPDSVCQGNLAHVVLSGAQTYTWNNQQIEAEFSIAVDETVNAVIAGANGLCVVDTTISIAAIPIASLDLGPDLFLEAGHPASLDIADAFQFYQWIPANGLSCDNCPNPQISPTTTTQYILIAG